MRITSKPVLLSVPVVMVTALIAVLALWATGIIGGGGVFGGASSVGTVTWNVEYWHRNAAGELLQYNKAHNTITAEGLEVAMERLIDDTTVGGATAAGSFDQIALLNVADSSDPASNGILAASILDLVDGQNDGEATVINNPEDGTYSDVGSGTDGDGSVAVTFQGTGGDPGAALGMVLGKFAADDNQDTAGSVLAAEDILAQIDINVDLAESDTLTITWTINISP